MTTNLPTKLLRAVDVAEILNVSKPMVYKLMRTNEIPTVKIGKAIRVRPADLHNFIRENLISANRG
jgi:excisionase family DNA binding protein